MINRKGKIKVSKVLMREEESLKPLLAMFSMFVPIFMQEDFKYKIYYGHSPAFREVKEEDEIPQYEAYMTETIDENQKKCYTCKFEEI